ncbi:MAG: LysM peptidoglycan-binding domain-containing protein [Deltaproteobacteria bacterium]|nr:LysM peptidoglycan-binding domain-containing protein [Deltaproteobacteria bacterium]
MLRPAAAASLLLLASSAAHAGPTSTPLRPSWEEPATEPGEGSLWDFIEDALGGQPPTDAVMAASGELAEERNAEEYFLDTEEGRGLLDALAWYRDPVAFLTADPLRLSDLDVRQFDLPIVVNEDVERWMRYFTGRGRKYYARWLGRSTRYRPLITERLAARNMPQDLFYLSMIESGFSPNAYSSAAAVGLWQFIASTGMAYGLRVDWWVDERRDPERSTDAALEHLADLYEMFGDWYLAAAAYNAGAGRVRKATSRTGSHDFWVLAKPGILAAETRNYVPKLIAATIIGHHPERYGFTNVEYLKPLAFETVPVPDSLSVESLARCASISEEAFLELNPALRRWAVPPEPEAWPVRVPPGLSKTFQACVETIPPSERVAFRRHRVRKGESLGGIARKYGVTVQEIARMNKIRNVNRISVGTEIVIPVDGRSGTPATAEAASKGDAEAPVTWHTVRPGETIAGIAEKYGVTRDQIVAWNHVGDPDRIQAGSRLKVRASPRASKAAPQAVRSSGATATTYKVRRGDTLSGIAEKYKVAVSDLQAWNKISDPTRIRSGQTLVVSRPSGSPSTTNQEWTTYTVQSGDTLGAIARSHGCTVEDLKAWNSLASNRILPGQVLKIRR